MNHKKSLDFDIEFQPAAIIPREYIGGNVIFAFT
jgi:hypothetical protein